VGGALRVPLDTFGPECRTEVEADGRRVAVFLAGGRAYAVDAACPHEGNPLVHGDVAGSVLTCAYHLWRFDLETGACLLGERPVRRYEARVEPDAVVVLLD
jgi:nitrite reductase/ring-hydroxylating ferredoxin subunit